MEKVAQMKNRVARVGAILLIVMILFGVAGPAQSVEAASGPNTIYENDFKRLKSNYKSAQSKISQLSSYHKKILNMYQGLMDKGDKRWVEMRFLYYEYNSNWYALQDHKINIERLMLEHPGFNGNGKVTNLYQARYTVFRLRNHVQGFVNRVYDCKILWKKAQRLIRKGKTG